MSLTDHVFISPLPSPWILERIFTQKSRSRSLYSYVPEPALKLHHAQNTVGQYSQQFGSSVSAARSRVFNHHVLLGTIPLQLPHPLALHLCGVSTCLLMLCKYDVNAGGTWKYRVETSLSFGMPSAFLCLDLCRIPLFRSHWPCASSRTCATLFHARK